MTQRITRAVAFAMMVVAGFAPPASAQLSSNLGALSGDNALGYLSPLPPAFAGTLNAAVFHTGHVPKASFNLSVGVCLMGVNFDDADRLYTPTDPPGFTSTASTTAPTVIGDPSAVSQPGQGGTTLFHPGGFDLSTFTLAAPQLEIGSILGTRAVVRWVSFNVGQSDLGKVDLFGVGGQHSISQYLPPTFPLDLAAGVFYQKLKFNDDLVVAKSLHFDLTGSKRFGVLQPYAAVGYDQLKLDSHYTSDVSPGESIQVDFPSDNHAHFTVGIQANLAFVKLHGEYNAAASNGMAVGVQFGN
jgi:hypothetical protein